MSGPLIPYLTLPEIPLDFLLHIPLLGDAFDAAYPPSIKPFGTLVAIGVYVGSVVAARHARQRGLDLKKMNDFIFWVVAFGFIGGHVFDAIFYHPDTVARDPLYLLKLWDGLSSFGGFLGAAIGGMAWKLVHRERILPYTDMVSSAFPLAWMFGRAGCSVAHDHPGLLSDAWYAVQYPGPVGFVGRYDLGLYECLLTIPMAATFLWLWRKGPRAYGFYAGWMCVSYAPVRFFLDFLRVPDDGGIASADPRYGGLTPAQWAVFGLLALGFSLLYLSKRQENQPTTSSYLDPDDSPPGDEEEEEEEEEDAEAADEKPKVKKKRKSKSARAPKAAPSEGT